MPITDIGSYPITMQEFIEHWINVNAFLGGTAATDLKLKGAYTLTQFTADRATLGANIIFIDSDNTLELAIADRDLKKQAIRMPLSQFRAAIESLLTGTKYEVARPTLPAFTTKESDYLDPFDDMANLWGKINLDATMPGFTPPMLLAGGYALTAFITEVAALRTAYRDEGAAEDDVKLVRASRDQEMTAAVQRMSQYRAAAVAQLPVGNPLLATIPDLWPAPGPAVVPVILTGLWNAGTVMADLSWTASTDANLGHYSVRYSPSVPYDPATEFTLSDQPIGSLAFATDQGLTVPNSTSEFRLYVVRTTGGSAGSNVVAVSRP